MKRIFLTVDVECHDIENINRWIYGKIGDNEYGLKNILEITKEKNIPINFFVDLPEMKRYGTAYIKKIIYEIKQYNQPIYLHLHPNYITGDETRTYLWQYDKEEQRKIFREAYLQYRELIGEKERLVFRMGRYGVDLNFYDMLSEENIKLIDLSYCYGNGSMCHLPEEACKTINNLRLFKGQLLLPNTSYVGLDLFGVKKILGLDVSQTCKNEMFDVIDKMDNENIVITMHVWDLFKRYFFTNKIYANNSNINKLEFWIENLQKRGYEFSKVETIKLTDIENQKNIDNLYNPYYGSFNTKVKFLFYNFIRFMSMARNSKKYFQIYFFGSLSIFILLLLVIKLLF